MMETPKITTVTSKCTNYGVQYIDVTNSPVFMGLRTGFVNPQTIKLRRSIDLSNVCEENSEGVLPGTEFTVAELEAILTDSNANNNKGNNQSLEVSPINSNNENGISSCSIQFILEESDLTQDKRLIDLNTPVYLDVTEQNEESIVIETDIGSSVEVTTEDLIESDSLMHNVDYGQTSNFDSEFNLKNSDSQQLVLNEEQSISPNETNNELISEEEIKLIEGLTNKHDKQSDYVSTMTAYNQSKNYEILKAAKSLYSKRTRTLWHWIDPKIPKSKLKNTVLLAWDNLPAWQKQIYISQVLGKFSMDVVTPMVNPQLAGIAANPPQRRDTSAVQRNVARKRMYVHKSLPKWNCCFKSKKKGYNGIPTQDSLT
ncbi:uncharacterized protein [Rhodnius prolixus]|uniref:uncharacterized protein n=1 Tax=Rhodnius prolixus TaxID=13249 RepID=UPI003D1890A7